MNEAMGKVRDYIALIMTLGMLIFVGLHVAIPDRLWDVYLAIIMFFFGSKQNDAGKDVLNQPQPKESAFSAIPEGGAK